MRSAEKAFRLIPPNASVLAQDPFVPHLANRDFIYHLGKHPEGANFDYVIISPELGAWPLTKPELRSFVDDLKESEGFTLLFEEQAILVFKKAN